MATCARAGEMKAHWQEAGRHQGDTAAKEGLEQRTVMPAG